MLTVFDRTPWGFPLTQPIARIANYVVQGYIANLDYDDIQHHTVLADCTWMFEDEIDTKLEQVRNLHAKLPIDCIVLTNPFDEDTPHLHRFVSAVAEFCGTVHCIGNFDSEIPGVDVMIQFPFMSLLLDMMSPNYTEEQLVPVSFDKKYLCYFGKPHPYRVELWDLIKDNVQDAVVNFNGYSEPLLRNTFECAVDTDEFHDGSLGLGNLEYWKQSFLVIVLETMYGPGPGPENNVPFLSEKIFKPIMGKRPFLVCGQTGTSAWLLDNGFMTFNDFFDYPQEHDLTVREMATILNNLDPAECNDMYNHMQLSIDHNYKRYREFVGGYYDKLFVGNIMQIRENG